MSKRTKILGLIVVVLLGLTIQAQAQTVVPSSQQQVRKLIAVLDSDASRKEKADACRLLSIVGTKDAVPVLADLLADEELAHMARYALEPIPHESVDQALRAALDRLDGRLLVGVIGSLGVREDDAAVPKLIPLLKSSDRMVAQATARALGSIGSPKAAEALQEAVEGTHVKNRLDFCEGLFRCAEAFAAKGQKDRAIAIYDRLKGLSDAPHQVRGGALKGAILARGNTPDALALLKRHLRDRDYVTFSAAVQTTLEMHDADVTDALTGAVSAVPADNQILIVQALGARGDTRALPSLSALARNADKPVRLAAIDAIPRINGATGMALVGMLDDDDRAVAEAARESFASIPNPSVDDTILKMFKSGDTDKQLVALELMGRRRMTDNVSEVMQAARQSDARVRPHAIRKVGELGDPEQLPAMLDLLTDLMVSQDLEAARQAVSALCAKKDNPESCADQLIDTMSKADPAQKTVLLRVLGGIGGPKALLAVRKALDDSDKQVHAAAIRVLSTWNTADAAPYLLELARKANTTDEKILALRGYLGFASRPDLPANQRLSMCRQAEPLAKRTDVKKVLLGALGSVNSPGAVEMILPYLKDDDTRAEAAAAALGIADRLLKGRNAAKVSSRLIEPLQEVADTTDKAAATRARQLLQQAREKTKKN